jgi:hypothetical protein
MKRLLLPVIVLSFLFISCATTQNASEPTAAVKFTPSQTSVSLTSTASIPIPASASPSPEPSVTATEAPKAMATLEIQDITFTNTDGVNITMPECTGPNAAQNCMDYLSKNALWVTGHLRDNDWFGLGNHDAVKVASVVKKIPGYKPTPSFYPQTLSDPSQFYIDFIYYPLGSGTVIYFQDQQKHTNVIYINGVTPDDLSYQLSSGTVEVPNPNPTTAPTP